MALFHLPSAENEEVEGACDDREGAGTEGGPKKIEEGGEVVDVDEEEEGDEEEEEEGEVGEEEGGEVQGERRFCSMWSAMVLEFSSTNWLSSLEVSLRLKLLALMLTSSLSFLIQSSASASTCAAKRWRVLSLRTISIRHPGGGCVTPMI